MRRHSALPLDLCTILVTLALGTSSFGIVVPLPPDVRAEGVAHVAGNDFISSDWGTGDIYMLNAKTCIVTRIVRAAAGRHAYGVFYAKDMVFAAGGGPGLAFGANDTLSFYVYHMANGSEVTTCTSTEKGFANDVIVDSEFAYFTDSTLPRLYALRLASLPACDMTIIPLPPSEFSSIDGGDGTGADSVYGNGIIKFNGGLIVSSSFFRTVYFVDLLRGNKVRQMLPHDTFERVDGLFLSFEPYPVMYVAEARNNTVSVWRLYVRGRVVDAVKIRDYVRPDEFVTPTSVAVFGDYMVTANPDILTPVPAPEGSVFTLAVVPL